MAEGEIAEGEAAIGRQVDLLANLRGLIFDSYSGGERGAGRILYGDAQFTHIFLGVKWPGELQSERAEGKRSEGAQETLRHRITVCSHFARRGEGGTYDGSSAVTEERAAPHKLTAHVKAAG